MARKPQRSSSPSRLGKDLTDVLRVRTFLVTLDGASPVRGTQGLLRAPGAVPGSGADTGLLDSGGGLSQGSA